MDEQEIPSDTFELPYIIDPSGNKRPLGHVPEPQGKMRSVPSWTEQGFSIIPESQWEEFDDFPYETIKIKDQNGFGACFPAGTRVRMADGSEKHINNVSLNDLVVTAEGNIGRVIRTMVRDENEALFRLKLWGHNHLLATSEHPILTERGYVPISQLKAGDWVAMPMYLPKSSKFIHVFEHVEHKYANANSRKSHAIYTHNNEFSNDPVYLPDVIEMTPGLGRLIGFYLAEGRASDQRVVWTFGSDESSTHVEEVVRLLADELGLPAKVVERSNNSINVITYGSCWEQFFSVLCGVGEGNKRISSALTSGPEQFLSAMLDAWLDGDGHSRRNEIQGVTISRDLALGMFDIAQALGRRPTIRRYHSSTYGSVKTRQPRWEVSMGSSNNDTYRCKMTQTNIWRSVKSVEKEEFSGPVFNLEVEGDNSYVAESIGVHNCNGHAAAITLEMARYVAGMPHIPMSAWWIYWNLTGGRDSGSNISDALELLRKSGCAPESDVPYGGASRNLKWSDAAKSDAPRFRAEIGASLTTYEEIGTAIQRRQACNVAVVAGNAFMRLDSEGVPGFGMGWCNHAVGLGLAMKKSSKWGWLGLMPNSWNVQYGLKGFCWLPLKIIVSKSAFDAYTIKAVTDDPNDPTKVPTLS